MDFSSSFCISLTYRHLPQLALEAHAVRIYRVIYTVIYLRHELSFPPIPHQCEKETLQSIEAAVAVRGSSPRNATTSSNCIYQILYGARLRGYYCTMVENRKKHRQNSHLIIHFTTSERCERTSERTSEWPSTSVCILGCYRP